MITLLAIETSTELASAALLHGNHIICRESLGVATHSQTILPMVQTILAEAGISIGQCDAIAVGVGPGSFTGVRTACGVVQGLAFGGGLSVVPVVTLAAMAYQCYEKTGAIDILAVLDARMGEVYWAQYRYENGWETVVAPTLSLASAVVPTCAVVACGSGVAAYATEFAAQPLVKQVVPDVVPHAQAIAQLGRMGFESGISVNADAVQPLYLRNKVADTTAERRAKVSL